MLVWLINNMPKWFVKEFCIHTELLWEYPDEVLLALYKNHLYMELVSCYVRIPKKDWKVYHGHYFTKYQVNPAVAVYKYGDTKYPLYIPKTDTLNVYHGLMKFKTVEQLRQDVICKKATRGEIDLLDEFNKYTNKQVSTVI